MIGYRYFKRIYLGYSSLAKWAFNIYWLLIQYIVNNFEFSATRFEKTEKGHCLLFCQKDRKTLTLGMFPSKATPSNLLWICLKENSGEQ